jgi:hypothetical protein
MPAGQHIGQTRGDSGLARAGRHAQQASPKALRPVVADGADGLFW